MTNHVARLYALATALIVFFAVWLAVATHPWAQASPSVAASDPQIVRLQARERHLRAETRRVNRIVNRRYAAYGKELARRNRLNASARLRHRQQLVAARIAAQQVISAPSAALSQGVAPAAAPQVRVVTLPPLAATRTS